MFFLAQGSAEVLVRDNTKKETFVHELNSGDMFGEVALIFQTKRTASVRSKD
jgi:CRP-like cAMP-binding protein